MTNCLFVAQQRESVLESCEFFCIVQVRRRRRKKSPFRPFVCFDFFPGTLTVNFLSDKKKKKGIGFKDPVNSISNLQVGPRKTIFLGIQYGSDVLKAIKCRVFAVLPRAVCSRIIRAKGVRTLKQASKQANKQRHPKGTFCAQRGTLNKSLYYAPRIMFCVDCFHPLNENKFCEDQFL